MVNIPISRLLLIIFVFLSGLLLSGCEKREEQDKSGSKEERLPTPTVRSGGTYRYPLMNNPSTLDPAYIRDQYGETVAHQIFDGLVRFDPFLAVLPSLAEDWQVADNGTTYRFVLRKNVQFHNGQLLSIDDVVFSITRLLRADPPPVILPHLLKIVGAKDVRSRKIEHINGIEPVDDHTFNIRLEEPHAPFLPALAMVYAKIVPKKELIESEENFWKSPVGTGPFRFVGWEENQSIQLERFSNYHAGESLLNGIEYLIFPGVSIENVLERFQEKNLEEMPVYGKIRETLSAQTDLQWFQRPSLSLLFYGINCRHALLKNPDIRKALSMAIDRKKLVQECYKGQFEPARTILPPGMPGYRRQSETVVENIARARELTQAVLGDATTSLQPIEIVSVSQSSFAKAELRFISESWKKLGLSVVIKFVSDWKEFTEYRNSESVQIYRASWTADMPDPDSFLNPLFASDSPVNYMHYSSKEVDRLLKNAVGMSDPVKRAETYQQIESIIVESAPVIPLVYISVDRVYQPYVQGIEISALGSHTMPLNRVWLKDFPVRE